MNTYKFKTNINCGGCIATVTPFFEDQKEIKSWEVDTENKDKILVVETTLSRDEVKRIVEQAGFNAKPLKKGFFGLG